MAHTVPSESLQTVLTCFQFQSVISETRTLCFLFFFGFLVSAFQFSSFPDRIVIPVINQSFSFYGISDLLHQFFHISQSIFIKRIFESNQDTEQERHFENCHEETVIQEIDEIADNILPQNKCGKYSRTTKKQE